MLFAPLYGRRTDLVLVEPVAEAPPDERERVEDGGRWLYHPDLLRIGREECRGVDERPVVPGRQRHRPLAREAMHLADEGLEAKRRTVDVDDLDRLVAVVFERVRDTGRDDGLLPRLQPPPLAVDEDIERSGADLVALLGARMDMDRRTLHPRIKPIDGLEPLAVALTPQRRTSQVMGRPGRKSQTSLSPLVAIRSSSASAKAAAAAPGGRSPVRSPAGRRYCLPGRRSRRSQRQGPERRALSR